MWPHSGFKFLFTIFFFGSIGVPVAIRSSFPKFRIRVFCVVFCLNAFCNCVKMWFPIMCRILIVWEQCQCVRSFEVRFLCTLENVIHPISRQVFERRI